MKTAIITGITGQDGSYLAEFLLKKGYDVHGVIRRASTFNTSRIDMIYQDPHAEKSRLHLHYGDLADANTIRKLIYQVQPDEIYNLAAQSHVRVSFDIPEYTANVTGVGVLRMLEAVKDYEEQTGRRVKFYQASSSEMFGSAPPSQNEATRFQPRSPYGVAKVFAYYTVVNYREAYGLFASNGILFNHETIAGNMPMFYKKSDGTEFDIKPISEIVPFDEERKEYQSQSVRGLQVWGKAGWVDVRHASAYPHNVESDNKKPRFINARNGAVMATSSHVGFFEGGIEKKFGDITIGEKIETVSLPRSPETLSPLSLEEAELLGMMVGDGSFTASQKGMGVSGKFTNSSPKIRGRFTELWRIVTGGSVNYYPTKSGFSPYRIVGQLGLSGGNDWLRTSDIYNRDRTKRIPKIILNSSPDVMYAFLQGYNTADGLKENLCTYEFRNFKTNSPTLAMGLWYLIESTTHQTINLTLEEKEDGRVFYSLNLLTTTRNVEKENLVREYAMAGFSQRALSAQTGISRTFIRKIQSGGSAVLVHHLQKDSLEVKKIIEMPEYRGWFYDLETSSGEFHCGVGKWHVHNSPRRGETFVTRKITRGVASIVAGCEKKLYLGNLDARRDWGYAPEYVEAMWMMLQQPEPDDFVIGTGETHSVRDFVEACFSAVGLRAEDYVEIDPRYYRPAEVDDLVADASKAREKLGWKAKVGFGELVKLMLRHDLVKAGLKDCAEKI